MNNIIQFPGSRLSPESIFNEKFDKALQGLPPELSKCLKEVYKRVSEKYATELPSFELHISDVSGTQTEQIKTAVAQLMDDYKERVLLMLKSIMELEAEICMFKFKLKSLSTPNH